MRWIAGFCLVLVASACVDRSHPKLTPDRGELRGGERVLIRDLEIGGYGPVVVTFAGVPARSVVIEGEGLIRVTTPPSSIAGDVDVELLWADGTKETLAQGFAYDPRTIDVRPTDH